MGQGGAEKVVFQLCKDNKNVTSFIASSGGEYVNDLKKNVTHIDIPDIDKKNPYLIIKTFVILLLTVKKYRIDIVHSHHRMAAFYSRILQIFYPNLKHVYTAHNVFYGKKNIMRFALSKAFIIACGNTVKLNLVKEYLIPANKIKVIFNSIQRTPIKDIHISCLDNHLYKGDYLIGCIGRFSEQKGIDLFLKAVALCKKKIPYLVGVIIGEGEEKNNLVQLVDSLGIKDNIVFLGFQKEVLSIIVKMKFVVLPSRWEGFPLIPIETFSVGRTIIVSDIPNNLEIVKNNITGLSFKTEDYEDLAQKIIELHNNDNIRINLEKEAFKYYNDHLSYSNFLNEYNKVYTL